MSTFDDFIEGASNFATGVKDTFTSLTMDDLKSGISLIKDIKDIVSQDQNKDEPFVPRRMNTMKRPGSSQGMGYGRPSALQALGFTTSQDMVDATNKVLNSNNETVRAEFARSRRFKGQPTIGLDTRQPIDVDAPRVAPARINSGGA